MQYGYFDDKNREYVIERPDTPLPWMNYLGAQDYFGIITNTAGGYSFYRDARLRRITRYRYNNVPPDVGGRYIYLRDEETSEFWSPSWQPTRGNLESYSCRHGLGYTTISSSNHGVESVTRYFVPLNENLEIWHLTLTNSRPKTASLSVFSCIEFALWDAYDDMTNFQRNFNTGEVEVDQGVIYHTTEYRERRNHFAFFACSEEISGFDTQREVFLGPNRGWDQPKVVEVGAARNSIANGWAPMGSHHVQVALEPGEQRQMFFLLGYHENDRDEKFEKENPSRIYKADVRIKIDKYLDLKESENAFEELRGFWSDKLSVLQVSTPDIHTDRMLNIWNAYQCMVTFNLSRSASLFESGVGRGMGFRDSTQDLLGFIHMVPGRARQRILDLAATQLESGGAYHQYQPLTKKGNENVGGNFNDDPLWLILSVAAYIKETADWGVLDEFAPYDNKPGSETPLFEHLQRSIGYTLDRLGPHGLPLIGRADWNDCLNLNTFSEQPGESFQTTTNRDGKVAESVFIAGLFILAAAEMAEISERTGCLGEAAEYREAGSSMTEVVLKHGWDGDWFLRAYDDLGDVVGSSRCDEGQIYVESQGINIMAGVGLEDGQARQALQSVDERLATPHGILLHQPAYTKYRVNLGEISSYPPGYKENAGIFCHTNPWIMIAETLIGDGDKAFDYYLRINPSFREKISDVHRCEPYVYAQMIAGRDAPTHGEAKNSWLTGTAAWNFVAISQWILGIRPTYDGLMVAPVVPKSWPGFTVKRRYQGADYHIQVLREGPGNRTNLVVDGRAIEGNVVPSPASGQGRIEVVATLS